MRGRLAALLVLTLVLAMPMASANVFIDHGAVQPDEGIQSSPLIANSTEGPVFSWMEDGGLWLMAPGLSNAIRIDTGLMSVSSPSLAVEGSRIALAWNEGNNTLRLWLSGDIQGGRSLGSAIHPSISWDNGTLVLVAVWNNTIKLATMVDGGGEPDWADIIDHDCVPLDPSLSIRDGNGFMVWYGVTPWGINVRGALINDHVVSAPVNVSSKPSFYLDMTPKVSIGSNGDPWVVWERQTGDITESRRVMVSHWNGTFSEAQEVSDSSPSWSPEMVVGEDDTVHLAFLTLDQGHTVLAYDYVMGLSGDDMVVADCDDEGISISLLNGLPAIAYVLEGTVKWQSMEDRPPVCIISSPWDGAVISGNITINGTASDWGETALSTLVRLTTDTFVTDWVEAEGSTQWHLDVDSRYLPNGVITVEAVTYDESYHSLPATVSVTSSNPEVLLPDLAVTGCSISPLDRIEGTEVGLSATVVNQGTVASPETQVLSEWGGQSIFLTLPALSPGVIMRLNWTGDVDTGTVWLNVTVDPEGVVRQSDTSDDSLSESFEVTDPWDDIDLRIFINTSANAVYENEQVDLSIQVVNDGRVQLDNVTVMLALDDDPIAWWNVTIGPGGSTIINHSFCPGIPGDHEVVAFVDPFDQYHETDEWWNFASDSILVDQSFPWYPLIAMALVVTAMASLLIWRRKR